jgi:hypothetical protein
MGELLELIQKNKQNYSLCIASAFYEVKAFAPQIPCLLEIQRVMQEMNIPLHYFQLCGDSYPCRAKNSLVHKFLQSDYTHLMIIDSDETWEAEGFLRLIRASIAGFEIVAGLYPCKNNWEFYGGCPRIDEEGAIYGTEIDDMRLVELTVAPGGFIIYSRNAFERTRPILDSYIAPETGEYVLECFKVNLEIEGLKRHTPEELEKYDREKLIELVLANQTGGRQGSRIGEDVYFMTRYRRMGGQIWCEPNMTMGHFGIKEWTGNYHDYLMRSRGLKG